MFQFLAPIFGAIKGSGIAKAATAIGGTAFGKSLAQGVGTAAAARLTSGGGGQSQTSRINFAQLRDDAIAAGFNPLTALRATGGAGNVTTSTPSMSSGDFLRMALGEGVSNWFNRPSQQDLELEQIRLDTAREELKRLRAANSPTGKSFGYDLTEIVDDYRTGANNTIVRPQARPTAATQARMPVFLPDGSVAQIPRSLGERLGLTAWSQMATGEYAEFVGEIRGEGEAALHMAEIGQNMGVPMMGVQTPTPRMPEFVTPDRKVTGPVYRRNQ